MNRQSIRLPRQSRLICLMLLIVLPMVAAPVTATLEQEVVIRGEHAWEVRQLAHDGQYEQSLASLTAFMHDQPDANFFDAALALTRTSELLVYLDSKPVYEKYLPHLAEWQKQIDAAEPAHPKHQAICAEAAASHQRVKLAYDRCEQPAPLGDDLRKQIASAGRMNDALCDAMLAAIARIKSNNDATALSDLLAAHGERYAAIPEKYARFFIMDRLIRLHESGNPLRAMELADVQMTRARQTDLKPESELPDAMCKPFDDAVRNMYLARNTTFWSVPEYPRYAESMWKKQWFVLTMLGAVIVAALVGIWCKAMRPKQHQ